MKPLRRGMTGSTAPMPINGGMMSSNRGDWGTPWPFFQDLDTEFNFRWDVCATEDNAKCMNYLTIEDDALSQPWEGPAFMNPPYGRQIGKWVKKAWEEAQLGCLVVCLLPARTDTAWWHDWAMRGEIRFIRGRLRFEGGKDSAPFPSAVVIFRPPV
jgi:phage N-6-adenine-methyltransferase